ncbi:hypothetical protein JTE90_025290 [Oedothorax gibbosus]|uniref:Uncharacterized protein n=1 Tax=Oedothorax gibbosus TaxID=931172 RepID=A0AAV6TSY3_9ARAC|nr:hypothetical protein JTE90_025290 [Oedothorax gibbosus]
MPIWWLSRWGSFCQQSPLSGGGVAHWPRTTCVVPPTPIKRGKKVVEEGIAGLILLVEMCIGSRRWKYKIS